MIGPSTIRDHSCSRAAKTALVLLSLALGACTDISGPFHPPEGEVETKPPGGGNGGSPTVGVPTFVFVSNESGVEQLYRFRNDTITRLTFSNWTDRDPHSAAGKLVFTSYRDGNAEIYLSANDGSGPVRLTSAAAIDEQPALSPDGATVAFVSTRSGTPRVWLMNADGTNAIAVSTGSPSFVPERAPSWSPSGDRIAFTSTRSGSSQVWVMPAAGGEPVQLTFESGGAFDPRWSPDGATITYTTTLATTAIRSVNLSTGAVTMYATASANLGQAVCDTSHCLVVHGAYGSEGDIVAYTSAGSSAKNVVTRAGNDVRPALLVD